MGSNRQHGAMEYTEAPTDLDEVRRYRLGRVREQLVRSDCAGIVLYDSLNLRYATDVTNMPVWSLHNENRYAFIATDGPVILFEYYGCAHLAEDIPTIDEIRPPQAWYYMNVGPRGDEIATKWADEVADLVSTYGGGNRRLAVDRAGYDGLARLAGHGVEIVDGFAIMEQARVIKSPGEIELIRCAVDVCQQGMDEMYRALEPGVTENALWARLHETNVRLGGEWIETRLLSSGPRTNPWYREASMRRIGDGDLISFDTDMIGPYGYCADISRGWVCGDAAPSPEQERLHALARAQVEHNLQLLRPGASFREVSERAWPVPERYREYRYTGLAHGVGLCDEYPTIWEQVDWAEFGYDGIVEVGMVLCVESYIGEVGGRQGIKLEQQVLVTESGPVLLSEYPLDLQPDR